MYRFKLSTKEISQIIHEQFPRYKDLEIKPVEKQGNDNRTYRLGNDMITRFPYTKAYASHIEVEHMILKAIHPYMNDLVPSSLHIGKECDLCPFKFVINTYIKGEILSSKMNKVHLMEDLCLFFQQLHSISTENLPLSGEHNFYRGHHPNVYIKQLERSIETYNVKNAEAIVLKAQESKWNKSGVIIHGDLISVFKKEEVMLGNIITHNERLKGIIDWGTCAVGDPSCDLIILWTYFNYDERRIFKKLLMEKNIIDNDTYIRGAMWALWQTLNNVHKGFFEKEYGINLANEIINEFIL